MRFARRLPLFAAAGLLARIGGAAPLPLGGGWAHDTVWDDGRAEVAVYAARRPIYGASRAYEAVLLTVKEEFDTAKLVKADPPLASRTTFTVIKQNVVREIPTPNYDYRITTSAFVERGEPGRLVKLAASSQEWCGVTWKLLRVRGDRASYEWSSYFDAEADGRQEFEWRADDLVVDQLPLSLRGLSFRDGLEFDARLHGAGFATNHGAALHAVAAHFRVSGPQSLRLPIGDRQAWRVDVNEPEGRASYWFDVAGTHPLLRLERSDGEGLELSRLERRAYWVLP